MSDDDPAVRMGNAIAALREHLAPVLDAAEGYAAECRRRGISTDAASAMAADFHRLLVEQLARSMARNSVPR